MDSENKTREELLSEISELVRKIEELKKGQEETHKIFSEATTEAIFIHENGKIVAANEAFYKLFHFSQSDKIIGMSVFDLADNAAKAKITEQLQTKNEAPFVVNGIKKGGEAFIAEVIAKTIEYKSTLARVVLVRDITIKEQYQQFLVESEDKYKKLISNIPAGLIIHIGEEIFFVNDQAFEILGARGAKIEDFNTPSIYDFILPEYHDKVKDRIIALQNGEDIPMLSIEAQTFDGKIINIETKSSAVKIGEKTAIQTVFFDVTERLKIQERLSENEEKLTQILTNIEDIVYYVDILPDNSREVKYISPHIKTVLGISESEYKSKGNKLSDRCHPDDLPKIIEAAIKLKNEKQPQQFVYRFKHGTTDEYVWIEERVFPRIDDGVHVGNFGITRNVNRQKLAENETQKTKEQLSLILNNIDEIVYYLSFTRPANESNVVFVNDKIESILGITKGEFSDNEYRKKLISRAHPDDRNHISETSDKLRKEKRAQRYQYRFKHGKTNEYIWVEEWVYPQYENGKHTGNFGVTRDISELINKEEQVKISEERFRNLADNALDIVYRYTLYPEPKYEYVSASAEHITGYSVKEFYANPFLGFELVHPDDKHLTQSSQTIIEKGARAAINKPKPLQLRWIRKDGAVIWTETLNKLITDSQGKVVAIEGISRDITERRAAEDGLRQSEEKFALLSNSAPIGIFLSDASGTPYYANKKLEKITGLSIEKIINKSWFKHLHPLDAKNVARRVRESVLNQVDFSEEFRVRNLHTAKWVKFQATTIWSFDKKLIGWVGTIEDISERKENEEKVIASERRYRMLFENNMAGVYRVALDGTIIECNEAFVKIFEFSSAEEIKKQNALILYFENKDRETYINHLKQNGKATNYQQKLKTKTGREIHVLINTNLIEDPITKELYNEGTLIDITPSVEANKALRESERALSTLMNNLPGMAYRCWYDDNWTMKFVSSGCYVLTGYKSEELIENKIKSFSEIVYPEDKIVGKSEIKKAISTKTPFEIEYRILTKDKKIKWVWEKGEGVFNDEGELLFIEGFITDITDRKEYEERIKQNNENHKGLIENSPDGIFIHDFDGKIIFANPAALKLLGIKSIKEVGNKNMFSFFHQSKHKTMEERRTLVIGGEEVPFFENTIVKNDGTTIDVETKPTVINYENQRAILLVCHDLSFERKLEREQMRAEIAEQSNKKLQQEIAERKNAERILRETQKYTRLLIDSSIDMICATDKEGLLTEFNPAAQRVFGYSLSDVLGKHVSMLYANPTERVAITNNKLYKQGAFAGEVLNKKRDGTFFPAFLSASVLKDEEGKIIGAMGVSRDITEIKEAEQNLKSSEERYRAIYNQAYVAIAQIDKEGRFLQVNNQLTKITGFSNQELLARKIADITHPDDQIKSSGKNKAFIIGEKENTIIEKRFVHKSGHIIYASITMSLVKNNFNKPEYAIVVIQDVTEKKKAEQQIKAQAAKLNAIIESSSHHIWTVDSKYAITSFNRNFSELIHRQSGIWIKVGDTLTKGKRIVFGEQNDLWNKMYDEVFSGKPGHFETSFLEKNGNKIWLEIYLNPIIGSDGNILEVSGIGHDVTEKKRAEEQIKLSLNEKEVLLKEVHHRVKNNIQVISSILNLQSSYVKDINTINMLKECQNRIKSMAFIHESLYQTKDFSKINFQEYLTKLIQNLVYSYEMQNSNIKLTTKVDNIMLNLDQSIPCGLIVNELISNALKYAFKGRKKGEISVTVTQDKGERVTISVADNGVGLPAKLDYKNTDSLGLQLVVTLTEQIGGNIKLFRKKGTKFTIVFKQQPVKSRI